MINTLPCPSLCRTSVQDTQQVSEPLLHGAFAFVADDASLGAMMKKFITKFAHCCVQSQCGTVDLHLKPFVVEHVEHLHSGRMPQRRSERSWSCSGASFDQYICLLLFKAKSQPGLKALWDQIRRNTSSQSLHDAVCSLTLTS